MHVNESVRRESTNHRVGAPLQLLGHTSVGRMASCTVLVWRSLWSLGEVLLGFNPLRSGQVYRLAPEAPFFSGMMTGPEAFLGLPDVSGLQSCDRTHLKSGLVPHTYAWWGVCQISVHQSAWHKSRVIPFAMLTDRHYHTGLSAFYQLTTV